MVILSSLSDRHSTISASATMFLLCLGLGLWKSPWAAMTIFAVPGALPELPMDVAGLAWWVVRVPGSSSLGPGPWSLFATSWSSASVVIVSSISTWPTTSVGWGDCRHFLAFHWLDCEAGHNWGGGCIWCPHVVGMVEDLFNHVGVELVVGNGVPYRLREGPPPDAQNYVGAVTPGQGSCQGIWSKDWASSRAWAYALVHTRSDSIRLLVRFTRSYHMVLRLKRATLRNS